MTKNLKVLVMGGDNRYLEVINKLASNDVRVFLTGFDQLSFSTPYVSHRELMDIDFSMLDAILLPVSGTDSNGVIETTYSDKTIKLTEYLLNKTPKHCVIYTGIVNDFLVNIAASTNRKLVRLFSRNDIAIYNSIPTAEATLKLAIEETDFTIHGSNVLILGFGRIGMTIARLFSAIGANVTVTARKTEHFARISEMGLKSISTEKMDRIISSMDICINTIPKMIIDSSVINNMSTSTLILDLASKPGGTDFEYACKKGIKAIHALGLPGKTAPRTAGEIIGSVLLELLNEIDYE
ncbi:dipicolinate synthase subunit DpsA [Oceanobacillus halophilus]|uniref:Dipicolinate synthase subunit DpsA n=1 Tax=Oceanobacillus halophilus TaxID=930130 RepID=A0A495ABP1_9BACI|nr:dipicolinate synthase subunit DpsA [Oceanobacillus halophilus]RKQ37263.1 dipicolinate synthase subunit DpsA [Oceanobacillus halophilus]